MAFAFALLLGVAAGAQVEECGSGHYRAPPFSVCAPCPAGKFKPTHDLGERNSVCVACPRDAYSKVGWDHCNRKKNAKRLFFGCAPGWRVTKSTLSILVRTGKLRGCIGCPAGQAGRGGLQQSCAPCLAGQYNAAVNPGMCRHCRAGRVALAEGAKKCTMCAERTTADKSRKHCLRCAQGRYWVGNKLALADKPEEGQCAVCDKGKYADTRGATMCHYCKAAQFSDSEGNHNCWPCPPGKYTADPGQQKCGICNQGHFQGKRGATKCSACDAGRYADALEATECRVCPAGKYTSAEGQLACDLCEAGRFSTAADNGMPCDKCPAGTSSLAGAAVCTAGTHAKPPAAANEDDDIGDISDEAQACLVDKDCPTETPTCDTKRCVKLSGRTVQGQKPAWCKLDEAMYRHCLSRGGCCDSRTGCVVGGHRCFSPGEVKLRGARHAKAIESEQAHAAKLHKKVLARVHARLAALRAARKARKKPATKSPTPPPSATHVRAPRKVGGTDDDDDVPNLPTPKPPTKNGYLIPTPPPVPSPAQKPVALGDDDAPSGAEDRSVFKSAPPTPAPSSALHPPHDDGWDDDAPQVPHTTRPPLTAVPESIDADAPQAAAAPTPVPRTTASPTPLPAGVRMITLSPTPAPPHPAPTPAPPTPPPTPSPTGSPSPAPTPRPTPVPTPFGCQPGKFHPGRLVREVPGYKKHCMTLESKCCTKCGAGQFQTGSGAYHCTTCPGGKYAPRRGSTACATCKKGHAAFPGRPCLACFSGWYQPTLGSTSCLACDKGQYSEYTPVGAVACQPCLKGKTTSGPGQPWCNVTVDLTPPEMVWQGAGWESAKQTKHFNVPDRICPGGPGEQHKQESGFVNIGDGKRLFFWFTESAHAPADAPLVLWLSSLGCSSVTALLTQNGPCVIPPRGAPRPNQNAWTTRANMIWLDQPAPTGFSRCSSSSRHTSCAQGPGVLDMGSIAHDVAEFMRVWYKQHTHMMTNDLYVFSEGHGHFAPLVADYLIKNTDHLTVNLRGIGIGSALIDPQLQWLSFPKYLERNHYSKALLSSQELVALQRDIDECIGEMDRCKVARHSCAATLR